MEKKAQRKANVIDGPAEKSKDVLSQHFNMDKKYENKGFYNTRNDFGTTRTAFGAAAGTAGSVDGAANVMYQHIQGCGDHGWSERNKGCQKHRHRRRDASPRISEGEGKNRRGRSRSRRRSRSKSRSKSRSRSKSQGKINSLVGRTKTAKERIKTSHSKHQGGDRSPFGKNQFIQRKIKSNDASPVRSITSVRSSDRSSDRNGAKSRTIPSRNQSRSRSRSRSRNKNGSDRSRIRKNKDSSKERRRNRTNRSRSRSCRSSRSSRSRKMRSRSRSQLTDRRKRRERSKSIRKGDRVDKVGRSSSFRRNLTSIYKRSRSRSPKISGKNASNGTTLLSKTEEMRLGTVGTSVDAMSVTLDKSKILAVESKSGPPNQTAEDSEECIACCSIHCAFDCKEAHEHLPRILGLSDGDLAEGFEYDDDQSSNASFFAETGTILAHKYEVINLLNSGTYSQVYLVRNVNDKHEYVLKVLSANKHIRHLGVLEYRYGKILRPIDGCVSAHEAFCINYKGIVHFCLLFNTQGIDGCDVINKMDTKGLRISLKDCVSIFLKLASIYAEMHDCGLIHGDLKPENILFLDHPNAPWNCGEVKAGDFSFQTHLIDFGCARRVISDKEIDVASGTLYYQAPETLLRKKISKAADMYSLGVCFFEFLTKEQFIINRESDEEKFVVVDWMARMGYQWSLLATTAKDNDATYHELLKLVDNIEEKKINPMSLCDAINCLVYVDGFAMIAPNPLDKRRLLCNKVINLLEALLSLDPRARPTARQTMVLMEEIRKIC